MSAWNDLTEEQTLAAKELGITFFEEVNPRTLPTYEWMRRNSDVAKGMKHEKLIAFGRIVLDTCKARQKARNTWGRAS